MVGVWGVVGWRVERDFRRRIDERVGFFLS